jgi:hypothetical protein
MRSEYLRNACHGDGALLQEVESLLALQDEVGRFINLPAIEVVAQALVRELDNAAVPANGAVRRLQESEVVAGRFEIVRFIAHGGMGDVYEARDPHLGTSWL